MAVDRRVELEQVVASGDEAAARFAEVNLRLVASIAKRHQDSGVPLLDLIQDGNVGLIHTVESSIGAKGIKFSDALRRGDSVFLHRRRRVAGLSLAAIGSLGESGQSVDRG